MNPNELRVTGRELQVFVKNVTRKEEEKDVFLHRGSQRKAGVVTIRGSVACSLSAGVLRGRVPGTLRERWWGDPG